jgi:hypothetical protein
VVLEVEAVEAHSGQHLDLARELDLVLDVGGGDVRAQVVVGIGRALPVAHGRLDRGRGEGDGDGRGRAVEEPRVAEVVGELASDLRARKEGVADLPVARAYTTSVWLKRFRRAVALL